MSKTAGALETTYPRRKQNRQTDFQQTDFISLTIRGLQTHQFGIDEVKLTDLPVTDEKLSVSTIMVFNGSAL